VSDHEQWGGNLRQDMTRVLAENLGRLLGSDRVVAAPHAVRTQPDFRVDVEVMRFERAPDGRVRLVARWWLSRGDGTLLASPSAELAGGAPGEAGSFDALVASMSAVYNELAVAIAQAIRARAKA
ncbi:MAG: PqiC family protein, partial [Betaproteobacteria bacterium]